MPENLTPREREIFDLLLDGYSAKEIANKLYISIPTVDFHRTNMYNKLGIHTFQELFIKYSDKRKTPTGIIIPAYDLDFFDLSDAKEGGNSTAEIFVTREEIDGVVIDSVLNIKANLIKRENKKEYAQAYTYKESIIQRLRQANGIRFKALGDGKSWFVEFKTIESTPERDHANYLYKFVTVRDQVIVVDISYSNIYLPEWFEQYSFDFNKETIKGLDIVKGPLCQYGSSLLKIFDFEIY
jgi:Response regulator containing a CheY-like receiver domain and an HTH DNA-binding domain